MYKQITLFLAVLFSAAQAPAWGLLDYCFTRAGGTCFTDAFIKAGKNPTVNLLVESTVPGGNTAVIRPDVHKWVQAAYNTWVSAVRNTIEQAGRTEEFSDFLNLFPSEIRVNLQEEETPGLNLHVQVGEFYLAEYEGGSARASTGKEGVAVVKWHAYAPPERIKDWNTNYSGKRGENYHVYSTRLLAHEIGHLWGLADLYNEKLQLSAAANPQAKDFSLLAVGIRNSEMLQSVMGTGPGISCDDIDGVINMYDILNHINNGAESARWQEGWESLCPHYKGKLLYAYGQPFKPGDLKRKAENKERLEALRFFKTGYTAWKNEAGRVNRELETLENYLNNAKRPLSYEDLWKSLKLSYLRERVKGPLTVYAELADIQANRPLLEQYRLAKEIIKPYANIAPGTPLYDVNELKKYQPSIEDFEQSVHYKKSKQNLTFSQLFFRLGKEKAGLDEFAVSFPGGATTPAQPRTPAAAPRVSKPAPKPAAKAPSKTLVKRTGTPAVTPSGTDQFSETALAGRPRAQVKGLRPVTTAPETPAPAKAAERVCAVCGKKITSEADAYIPPEKSRGPVHKHSECAFKYFARFYSVDNASLERYGKYYFLNEPSGVTAAKGLMKKLGLTPEEVKTYAAASREAARVKAQEQRESLERAKKWDELKAAYENACSGAYVKVSQADKEKFIYDNRVALNAIRRKQKENKKLTKKERLVWQNYQNMMASAEKQRKCEEAAAAWKAFSGK